jgi:hypothetical protein
MEVMDFVNERQFVAKYTRIAHGTSFIFNSTYILMLQQMDFPYLIMVKSKFL